MSTKNVTTVYRWTSERSKTSVAFRFFKCFQWIRKTDVLEEVIRFYLDNADSPYVDEYKKQTGNNGLYYLDGIPENALRDFAESFNAEHGNLITSKKKITTEPKEIVSDQPQITKAVSKKDFIVDELLMQENDDENKESLSTEHPEYPNIPISSLTATINRDNELKDRSDELLMQDSYEEPEDKITSSEESDVDDYFQDFANNIQSASNHSTGGSQTKSKKKDRILSINSEFMG